MAQLSEKILQDAWNKEHIKGTPSSNNCSGFIQTIIKDHGLTVLSNLNADGLVDHLNSNWAKIGTGQTGMVAAMLSAGQGKLVIVGAKSGELGHGHGHLAVVLGRSNGSYPYLYGGSIGIAQTQGDKTLNYIFPKSKLDILRYFAAP